MLIDFLTPAKTLTTQSVVHLNYRCPNCGLRENIDMNPAKNADKFVIYNLSICSKCQTLSSLLSDFCFVNGKAEKLDNVYIVYTCPNNCKGTEVVLSKLFRYGSVKIELDCLKCKTLYNFDFVVK